MRRIALTFKAIAFRPSSGCSSLRAGTLLFVVLLCWMAIVPSARAQFLQQGPKLVGSGGISATDQGASVAVSADGNTAIIGGRYDNDTFGAAWIFTRLNGVWSQQGNKLVGNGGVKDSFGLLEQGS